MAGGLWLIQKLGNPIWMAACALLLFGIDQLIGIPLILCVLFAAGVALVVAAVMHARSGQ